MAARDAVALNEAFSRLEVPQTGDTYNFPRAATFAGTLTVTGITTPTGGFAATLLPSADGTYNLGSTLLEWQDLWVDGTANIDSLVADTADINAGTIDATAIGGSTPAAGAFTTLSASGAATLSSTLAANGTITMGSGANLNMNSNSILGAVIDGGTY